MPNSPILNGNIVPTFFYYVIPSIIGLVAITTANLVDGMFLGNYVGDHALASITLLVPYFTWLIALSIMIAIGGSVRAGKYIGENKRNAASSVFSQSLILTLVLSILFALLSLLFEDLLYRMLGIPEAIRPSVDEYFSIIRWVLIVQLFTMVLYYFVRADGYQFLATGALICGATVNIILDAWFIVYLELGISGAAYATGIAQAMQLSILLYYFLSKQRTLIFSWINHRWSEALHTLHNGASEFTNEISVGIIFLLINGFLITRIGIDGVAAFSVVNYFIFLSVMLCYGIADAIHLLVSQNLGAGKYVRIHYFLSAALLTALGLACILIIILLTQQDTAISWFLKDENAHTAQLTSELLSILWPLFLVNGVNIILTSYLTAMHQPKPSIIIAASRSLILPAAFLSLLYFLPLLLAGKTIGKVNLTLPNFIHSDWGFLAALPLAEWGTFFIAVALCFHHRSKFLRQE